MIVVCQYTGVPFKSEKKKRTHPQVAAFLNAAFDFAESEHDGAYDAAKEILAAAAANGGGIEEIMSFANAAFAEWKTGASGKVRSYSAEEEEECIESDYDWIRRGC